MDRELVFDACPEPLAIIVGDVIREQNPSWAEIMESLPSLEACFAPEDHAAVRGAMEEAAVGRASFVARLAVGPERGAAMRCTVWSAGGEGRCLRLDGPAPGDAAIDIARAKEKALLWIFEQMDVTLWAIERDGTIALSEGPALVRYGLRPGQIVGLNAFEIYPKDAQAARTAQRVLAGEVVRSVYAEEEQTWVQECHPLRDDNGEILAEVGFAIAVTDGLGNVHQSQVLLQSVNELPVVIWAMKVDGTCTLSAGRGLQSFGLASGDLVGQNLFERSRNDPRSLADYRRVLGGESFTTEQEVQGSTWRTIYHPAIDGKGDVTGMFAISEDITARAQDEQRMREQLALIQAQKQAIVELVSPVIEVWRGVLVVPLIGDLGAERAALVTERLLGDVVRHAARFAILDLTGIDMVDTHTAQHLFNIMRAVDLLGCTPLVSGIRPSVATTMVSLGMDVPHNRTYSTLAEALRRCMRLPEMRGR